MRARESSLTENGRHQGLPPGDGHANRIAAPALKQTDRTTRLDGQVDQTPRPRVEIHLRQGEAIGLPALGPVEVSTQMLSVLAEGDDDVTLGRLRRNDRQFFPNEARGVHQHRGAGLQLAPGQREIRGGMNDVQGRTDRATGGLEALHVAGVPRGTRR